MTAHFLDWMLFCLGGDYLNRPVINQCVRQENIDHCWCLGIVSYKEFHTNNVIN